MCSVWFQFWKERSWACQPECRGGELPQSQSGDLQRRRCSGHHPPSTAFLSGLSCQRQIDAWDRKQSCSSFQIQNHGGRNTFRFSSTPWISVWCFLPSNYCSNKERLRYRYFCIKACALNIRHVVNMSRGCKVTSNSEACGVEVDFVVG